jgi:uracil-DNA glycosylase
MPAFCPGYAESPYRELVGEYPDHSAYPFSDFRVEWGPIFHRGRLDGTARALVIGQDPGQHENVLRRILTGEAGRRVQGFLAKLGIVDSYVLINALLYSVASKHGAQFVNQDAIRSYRERWLDALFASGSIEIVVTFGSMAHEAWTSYAKHRPLPRSLGVAHLLHPTFPMAAGGDAAALAANTKKMLAQWSAALPALHAALVHPDRAVEKCVPYAARFKRDDRVDIPARDLPPGIPAWMYDDDGWARRVGANARNKRRTIVLTVPEGVIP